MLKCTHEILEKFCVVFQNFCAPLLLRIVPPLSSGRIDHEFSNRSENNSSSLPFDIKEGVDGAFEQRIAGLLEVVLDSVISFPTETAS